jgi:hypothetical protein
MTIPSAENKKPDQLARTGFWFALAVFICLPALTGGARKLISNRRRSKVTRSGITCQPGVLPEAISKTNPEPPMNADGRR